MLKIAIVDHPWSKPIPPVQSGSISIWTWEVARRLAAKHKVVVYEGGGKWWRSEKLECQSVEYRQLWVDGETRVENLLKRFGLWSSRHYPPAAKEWYYCLYALRVAIEARRRRFDVIHVHQFSQFVPIMKRLNPSATIVLHMNCEWLSQFNYAMIQRRLRSADLIIGCSDHISNLISGRFHETAGRCRTVPNGVDVQKFAPATCGRGSREIQKILYVGRLSPEKGIHDLIDAFVMVAEDRQNAELDIVGPEWVVPAEWLVALSDDPSVNRLMQFYEGSYLDLLEKRIPRSVRDRIHFVGLVDNDGLPQKYHDADILVNPSLSESFGMTVAESMACGTPVIVSRVGGMKETVTNRENGLVVEGGNPKALRDALLELLDDPEGRQEMATRGRREVVKRFSWDRVAESLLKDYQSVSGLSCD